MPPFVYSRKFVRAVSTIAPPPSPIVAKNDLYPLASTQGNRAREAMQTERIYQVQHWPNGQWDRRHNWQKVAAGGGKRAGEKGCGLTLRREGRLAQLRARVLRFGDLKQRSATEFY